MIPIAHWKMNDNEANTTVADSVGTSNGTAQQNTEDITTTGKINEALSFNGTTDHIDCGDTAELNLSGQSVSFGAWVKYDTTSTNPYPFIIAKANGSVGQYYLWYRLPNKTIFYGFHNGTTFEQGQIVSELTTDWTHLFVVKDGNKMKLYKNNIMVSEFDSTGSIQSGSGDFLIGQSPTNKNVDRLWKGKIDDARVYNLGLSDAELGLIYNNGIGTEFTILPPNTKMEEMYGGAYAKSKWGQALKKGKKLNKVLGATT